MDIHDLTLEARRILIAEVSELLEGVYGLRQDGRFGASPALRGHAEAQETRLRLEKLIADEQAAGLGPKEAVEKLVKDAEAHAEEDRKRREEVEAKNQLDTMVYQVEKMLSENREKLGGSDVQTLESAISDARNTKQVSLNRRTLWKLESEKKSAR